MRYTCDSKLLIEQVKKSFQAFTCEVVSHDISHVK